MFYLSTVKDEKPKVKLSIRNKVTTQDKPSFPCP